MPLSAGLQQKLAQFHFITPTPVQASAIPPALEGKDILATAQTGTGKTVAFAIPAIERTNELSKAVQTLVLCPTRELAMQVADEFEIFLEEGRRDRADDRREQPGMPVQSHPKDPLLVLFRRAFIFFAE